MLRFQEEEAERASDFNKVAEIRYDKIPATQKELEAAQKNLSHLKERLLQEEVDEQLIAQIMSKVDRHPRPKNARRRSRKTPSP
ncbi:MAG: hypothetical protein LVR00_03715 [Rhabdochlamydiaceae bacterium]|jgi:ATP-dependent Clp protease ATP-binding subunit ClpB